ncbi:tyrosine-protein phosphatase non-receptor type substrate 1-like [Manacus vitellinus]|uniref:tyrosine-protein phosphatase non-receptor type substrate 1-like n=1 Tax=Manacus vitellinus TaxID=328815 RepID=UPI00115D6472|nr:tyrosine-protein phosphatase non-receptor type substrate 1-like [Manacus vitellinus]
MRTLGNNEDTIAQRNWAIGGLFPSLLLDVGISMAPGTEVLPLTCLMLLLLCRAPGSAPRVTRAVSGSDTDFTIHIRDVQPEDVGTYYCVKFTKSLTGGNEVFRRGTGTEVSVLAQPSPPIVSGPNQRAGPGQSVAFNCMAEGFFPKDISVKWFKDRAPISSQLPQVTEWREKSYNMSSSVTVVLGEGDVPSRLICEVQHSASETLLRGMYQLNRVLRVSPSVDVSPDQTSPIELNKTVKFTCHVKGFYPANVAVSWLENGMKMKVQNDSRPSLLHQGLLELRSQVEVQATEERNGSVFTCLVVHDDQAPVNQSAILWITSQKGPSKWSQINSGVNLSSSLLLLWLGMLLEKGILGGLLFFLFNRTKKEVLRMLTCPTVPQGGSQGLATTSHVV